MRKNFWEKFFIANLIDGKKCAAVLYEKIAKDIKVFCEKFGARPKLVVVIVGDDGASQTYVASKNKKALVLGMDSEIIALPASTTQEELLLVINRLNKDDGVNGILVQLPLPAPLDSQAVIAVIAPEKDVDGLTPTNAGRLALGLPALYPCTPSGCVILAKTIEPNLTGLHAVIIGRSVLVGKPLAALLLNENCTVTLAHSKTKNLSELAASADLLVAAAGKKHLVKQNWVSKKSIVLDVGIHRTEAGLTGDVAFDEVESRVRAITPVPGGVGPMTVACLMENTLRAAFAQKK